jgi:hypothetical protein
MLWLFSPTFVCLYGFRVDGAGCLAVMHDPMTNKVSAWGTFILLSFGFAWYVPHAVWSMMRFVVDIIVIALVVVLGWFVVFGMSLWIHILRVTNPKKARELEGALDAFSDNRRR